MKRELNNDAINIGLEGIHPWKRMDEGNHIFDQYQKKTKRVSF